jgi:hypothetical protein
MPLRYETLFALQSGKGRNGSETSCGVEADTVCRKAIRGGTWRARLGWPRHLARMPWERDCSTVARHAPEGTGVNGTERYPETHAVESDRNMPKIRMLSLNGGFRSIVLTTP